MSRLKVFIQRIYIVMRLWVSDIVTAARTNFLPAYTLKKKKSITKTKVCVLAIYQEGQLREDIKHLINTFLVLDCECIVINTRNITNLSDKLFDRITYIERPNWGRDFGSYQTGINYVLRHVNPASIERLVILNDSVFYCEAGLRSFLKGALEGPEAVTAVSENHNIKWHYASYFLSFGPTVIAHPLFAKFWKKYQKTNRRQATIRRGEMALSGCLEAIVGEAHLPRALFNSNLIAAVWNDQNFAKAPLQFIPTGPIATTSDLNSVMDTLVGNYLPSPNNVQFQIKMVPEDNCQAGLLITNNTTITELSEFLNQFGFKTTQSGLKSWFLTYILSEFHSGSQIHKGSILAIPCGIPIVKLDAIFRGDLDWGSIESIAMQLPRHQQPEFLSLFERQRYGASFLAGWKLTAFRYHLM